MRADIVAVTQSVCAWRAKSAQPVYTEQISEILIIC